MSKSKKEQVTTVGSLPPKSVFNYGGIEWIVLDNTGNNGVLCLAEKSLFTDAFDDTNCNNWTDSTLREYLNDDLLKKMVTKGAIETDFLSMTTDLTSNDGLKDYGSCEDTISLVSCNQYRKYRDIIPNINNWWWTCSTYSTKANGFSCSACFVHSDGYLSNYNTYYSGIGVRPLCTLKAETSVERNLI